MKMNYCSNAIQRRDQRLNFEKPSRLLHHDNASSHTFLRIKAFIEDYFTLPHASYGPDSVPGSLSATVKEKIKRKFFLSAEEPVAALELAISVHHLSVQY